MATTRCGYLHINGKRCTMHTVNGNELCFHHQSRFNRARLRPTPPSTFNTVPLLSFVYSEDHDAILDNINEIARALNHSMIDDHRAAILDRLMNTALRTLRQGQKLEKTLTCEEMVRHFRVDSNGNSLAVDTPAVDSPIEPESKPEVLEPSQIPAISAVAEDAAKPQPDPDHAPQTADLQRVTSSQNLSRLLSILTRDGEVSAFLSDTYIFRNGKLIVAPNRTRASAKVPSGRRATAYIFLTNMR